MPVFIIVPYHVDVPMHRLPWMNWILIGVTILIYPFCFQGSKFSPLGESLILGHGRYGSVGHVLVHAGIFHLLGNMLFLWMFGNAICAKVGNFVYPVIYFGLGLIAGQVSYLLDPRPAVGASGAINGMVGMFVVWYLLNDITCWYAVWGYSAKAGSFSISSYWMILLWTVYDVWGLLQGGRSVGYVAHLAGFTAGVGLAVFLLQSHLVKMESGERSLLQVLGGSDE